MNPAAQTAHLIAEAPPDGEDGPSGPTLAAALRDSELPAVSARLAHHPEDPLELLDSVQTVGRASLSAGRIFEGHVNAVKLIILHGGAGDDLHRGALYGIWGADGRDPDDETLGCGALIFDAASRGADCHIICVTDGSLAGGPPKKGNSFVIQEHAATWLHYDPWPEMDGVRHRDQVLR